jgi:hypothetical protein
VGLNESAYNDGRTITICPVYYAGVYNVHLQFYIQGIRATTSFVTKIAPNNPV